ncbi:MAG: hypothetical protein K0R09_241 [Clostridiales bacterium]|nr:hypothetical protein [Clostridiales bacterium]
MSEHTNPFHKTPKEKILSWVCVDSKIIYGGEGMKKVASFIVNHKKFILIFYLLAISMSFIGMRFVRVEYDMSSYLSKDMNSIQGRDILEKQFDIKGTAELMLVDKKPYEVVEIKNKIEDLPGVQKIIWMDDAEDIKKPVEFMDKATYERFQRGNYSLLQIQFTGSNDSKITQDSLKEIEKMMDGEYYLGGQAAVSGETQNTATKEMTYYSIVAVAIITIILLMATSSYLEPLLFFAAIGVAIIINMGTNFIFGRISTMTFSVASIIQLAVSMDYSIFLLHRYHEESQIGDKKDAMVRAIEKTFSSVSSSALTTVAGFLALVIMKYGIGKDMGLVLAKGVFLSLISVISLLPCLVLITDKKFSSYKHKILLPSFNKISKWIVKFRNVAIILVALIAIPAFLGQTNLKYYYSDEKTLSNDKKAVVANKKIDEVFEKNNELIVIIPKSDKAKINGVVRDIKAIENISSVEGLYTMVDRAIPESFVPESVRKAFVSNEYTYFLVGIGSDTEGEVTKVTIENLQKLLKNSYDKFYITGEPAIYLDLQNVTSSDFVNVSIISIILIGLILLITFKSITLPIILVFVIQLGIWINLSIPYFQGEVVNFISFIVIGAIQLGATVDYAILLTSRYKENLEELSPLEAMKKTISDTGRSVLTSVLILVAGTFSVYFITTIKSAAEITLLIGRGAIISLILVYVLLPALLLIFGRIIGSTTFGWPKPIKIENNRGCEK